MNTASLTIPQHHFAPENSGNKQRGRSDRDEGDRQLSQGRWRTERMNKWESRQSIAAGFKF
ncbi:hypothetical protein E2C01_002925 [Portunus trituberculatus]|uniref:Uncharacterized protein n=1 Tax=Portunus trituberculatus TaxID=210409 RepID=A0A5B7CS05_PORTR|nr:hypothetical protein [Portunus trituberculatus]